MPLQTGCLSVCLCASHDPHPGPCASLSNPVIRRKNKTKRSAMDGVAHLWASLNCEPQGFRTSTTTTAAGGISCISLIKVVGIHGALVRWRCQMKESSGGGGVRLCSQQRSTKDQTRQEWKQSKKRKRLLCQMISNWPFLPLARISGTVLPATLDMPTILPLKASFESGPSPKEVTITSKFDFGKKKDIEQPQSGEFIWVGGEGGNFSLIVAQAIELHLFDKEEAVKYTRSQREQMARNFKNKRLPRIALVCLLKKAQIFFSNNNK